MENIRIQNLINELTKYEDVGVFKRIYSDDKNIICSVLNQYYLTFNLEYIKHDGINSGVVMNSYGVKKTIEDESYWANFVAYLTDEQLKKMVIKLNDRYLQKLILAKPKYDMLPPSQNVDLQLEEELMLKNKSR